MPAVDYSFHTSSQRWVYFTVRCEWILRQDSVLHADVVKIVFHDAYSYRIKGSSSKLQQTHFAFVQKRIIDSRIVQILSVIIRRSAISSWLQFNAIWFLNWNCILILSIRWANGKDKAIKMWSRKVTRRKFRCIHWWFLNKALVWISHTGSLPTMSQSRGYVKQSCFYSSNKHIKPCTRRVM